MPKEAPGIAIPIDGRMPMSDIRGVGGPALLIKCPCALNGNERLACSQAMETSGRTYPREQSPLYCEGRIQYALDMQTQYTLSDWGSSAARVISMILIGGFQQT